jgi:DNA repair photolyase
MIIQSADQQFRKGRGAQYNPQNRFESSSYIREHAEGIDDWEEEERQTNYIFDQSKTIVNEVKSPDVGMLYSINPYQGCEHGCIYCYARNSHEYWGYSAGVDFERRIVVKENAPFLLRKFFSNKNWTPAPVSLSGNTDCYQPIERKMKLSRQLLEICLEFRNPVGIITKNTLLLRDLDLLQELATRNLLTVYSSVTSVDDSFRLLLEPRTATYKNRLRMIETLSKHNIPTGIMNAPIIPGLNDMHMHDTIKAAADAGARWAGYTIVRLNGAIGPIFKDWLSKTFPDRASKVWNQIEACHGGQVNDSRLGTRMRGEGNIADIIKQQFSLYCKMYGLNKEKFNYDLSQFRRLQGNQLPLF